MPVNGAHEGHPEEQLESFSGSTTLPVGKFLPGVNLTRTPKNTICSPPANSHLSQDFRLPLRNAITEPGAVTDMRCYVAAGQTRIRQNYQQVALYLRLH